MSLQGVIKVFVFFYVITIIRIKFSQQFRTESMGRLKMRVIFFFYFSTELYAVIPIITYSTSSI